MTIVVGLSLPPDAFELGAVFKTHPDARIDFERVVPASSGLLPYFWLSNVADGLAAAATTIRELSDTASVTKLIEADDKALFEVVWEQSLDHLVAAFETGHDGCIEVIGTSAGWELRLRFRDHERLTAFNNALTQKGIPVTLRQVEAYEPTGNPVHLSEEQQEALALARDCGYFKVPRECTVTDLADRAGISPSAFSERLRRGLDTLTDAADLSCAHSVT